MRAERDGVGQENQDADGAQFGGRLELRMLPNVPKMHVGAGRLGLAGEDFFYEAGNRRVAVEVNRVDEAVVCDAVALFQVDGHLGRVDWLAPMQEVEPQ